MEVFAGNKKEKSTGPTTLWSADGAGLQPPLGLPAHPVRNFSLRHLDQPHVLARLSPLCGDNLKVLAFFDPAGAGCGCGQLLKNKCCLS
jgi:hypothetical protein